MFNQKIFEQKIFDQYLEKQLIESTEGLTPQDRKIVKLLGRINKITSSLEGRAKVPQKTIDAVAFKLRKLKLLVDQDYRKTLTLKQRLMLDQIHQAILSHGIAQYLKDTGVEVIPYWDWSGVFRSMGTLWRDVITKYGLMEFLIFSKAKRSTMSYGMALYQAWWGLENDPQSTGPWDLTKPIFNRVTRTWHQLYVTGILSVITVIGGYWYLKADAAITEQVAQNQAAAEEITQIPDHYKERWVKTRYDQMILNYKKKNQMTNSANVPTDIQEEMIVAAEMMYEAELKRTGGVAPSN